VLLTDHPHVQGLLLCCALLAAAVAATPAAIDAARDLSHMPPPALAQGTTQGSTPAPDAPTSQRNVIGKMLSTPVLVAKAG
jgi:hypothetical protein